MFLKSVSELSSSLVRRPLSLLPSSPSADFTLFTSSTSATIASELGPAAESSLACFDVTQSWVFSAVLSSPHSHSRPMKNRSHTDRSESDIWSNGAIVTHNNDLWNDCVCRELIDGSRSSSTTSSTTTTSNGNNSNWLADLSVEVCKVETVEEGSNSDGGGGTGGPADWDESVFFEAAAAAAASSCCANAGQCNHHHHHHSHNAGNLDVLLGNPNLHNSSNISIDVSAPHHTSWIDSNFFQIIKRRHRIAGTGRPKLLWHGRLSSVAQTAVGRIGQQ